MEPAPARSSWLRGCATLCGLFCCPPLPSRIIAKLSFLPPNPPMYKITGSEGNEEFHFRQMFDPSEEFQRFRAPGTLTVFRCRTTRRNTVVAYLIRVPEPRFTILFSHGNAVDIGMAAPSMLELSQNLNCNVCAYDYSGYGLCTGRTSEKNIYADITAVWNKLQSDFDIPANKIILYGQSIGSAATVHLAASVLCAGVILHAPIASGLRVFRPNTNCNLCCDPFQNINKIRRVRSPVLFIHGEMDELVSISHSYAMLEECQNPVQPLFVPNAGHNDIEMYEVFMDRLVSFVLTLDSSAHV